jgi:hypothetical protein
LINASFSELLERHRQRMAIVSGDVRSFAEENSHEALLSVQRRLITKLVERGYAHYVDAPAESRGMWWTYTIRGGSRQMLDGLKLWRIFRQFRRRFFHPTAGNPDLKLPADAALVRWTPPVDSVEASVRAAVRAQFWMILRVNVACLIVGAGVYYYFHLLLPDFPWRRTWLIVCGVPAASFLSILRDEIRWRCQRRRGLNPVEHRLTADGIVIGQREIDWFRVKCYEVTPVPLALHRRQIVVRHASNTTLLLPDSPLADEVLAIFVERLGPPAAR